MTSRKGLFVLILVTFNAFNCHGIPPQEFIRQPHDQTAKVGDHVTLPCRVKNKRGMLQWTRDGFGLGVERNLTGFDRYHMTGTNDEGKLIFEYICHKIFLKLLRYRLQAPLVLALWSIFFVSLGQLMMLP